MSYEDWPVLALILIVIALLVSIKKRKQKSKTGAVETEFENEEAQTVEETENEDNSRVLTEKEKLFMTKAVENYHFNISIVLHAGEAVITRYRQQVTLSPEGEVCLQIEILHKEVPLWINCYFSGKFEMFYQEKTSNFQGFTISNITKALQELGFKNVGFPTTSSHVDT